MVASQHGVIFKTSIEVGNRFELECQESFKSVEINLKRNFILRKKNVSQCEDDFKRNMESNFSQQETQVRDSEGNCWIKCEFCRKIAKENEFTSYGGAAGHINLGTCKECSDNNPAVRQKAEEKIPKVRMKYDSNVCPECGGKLR